ncbi:MAG TPA: RNA polymerase factor sigma-54 [Castellaniella sp.]|uniref:RNA polymerase factor sigma-54 n=1 Tax=Castellaniella sp. TaxID=1955812 RepID=UPI002EF500E8
MQSQPFLGLAQRQQLSLTPQLRQALHLLQCSSQELALEIDQALATNPLLELADEAPESGAEPLVVDASPWGSGRSHLVSDDIPEPADTPGLAEHLLQQLHATRVSERDAALVWALIGELDDRGYLEFDPQVLAEQLPDGIEVADAEWRVALRLLQSFDPAGVAARDLPECLRLQLHVRHAEWSKPLLDLAAQLTEHLDDLAAARWGQLCARLRCDRESLEAARAVLRQLEPRPARAWSAEATHYAVPDVLVRVVRGQWQCVMNPAVERPIRVSPGLAADLEGLKNAGGLLAQLRDARSLLQGLQQRRQTVLRVAECIIGQQPGFREQGMAGLRALAQKDVAHLLELHESTVSRAVRLKYLSTPWGVFELRQFFSAAVATESGGETSAQAVQVLMASLLADELASKPLSDMRLAQLLAERGVVVARRTVAKYREAMGVLPASLRKS